MREIRFRGKRIDNGLWIFGYYHKRLLSSGDNHTEHRIINDFGQSYIVDEKTIGQCIEKKDVHKQRIYEGDIIKITGFVNAIGVVLYKSPSFVIREEREIQFIDPFHDHDIHDKEKYNDGKACFEYEKNFEIIGNIHTSKELLD